MTRLPADAPFWQRAPWNNPKLCPSCGCRAEVVVGARGYCRSCARTMRLFIGERGHANPLDVVV